MIVTQVFMPVDQLINIFLFSLFYCLHTVFNSNSILQWDHKLNNRLHVQRYAQLRMPARWNDKQQYPHSISFAKAWQSKIFRCANRILLFPAAQFCAAFNASLGRLSSGYFSSILMIDSKAKSNAHSAITLWFCPWNSIIKSCQYAESFANKTWFFFLNVAGTSLVQSIFVPHLHPNCDHIIFSIFQSSIIIHTIRSDLAVRSANDLPHLNRYFDSLSCVLKKRF